jgi:hypothetical protein
MIPQTSVLHNPSAQKTAKAQKRGRGNGSKRSNRSISSKRPDSSREGQNSLIQQYQQRMKNMNGGVIGKQSMFSQVNKSTNRSKNDSQIHHRVPVEVTQSVGQNFMKRVASRQYINGITA